MPTVEFNATPRQAEFIHSKAFLNFFMGPRGEGKTTTGVFAMLRHAMEHSADTWPLRWAIVRDTWENLRITTVPSIRDVSKNYKIPTQGLDKLEPKEIRLGTIAESGHFIPIIECHFFGLDQPEDANRLQGFECAGAWIEEPAPAADISSGVPEESLLAVTSLRQGGIKGVRPRVQITMNPPDEDHWTVKYRDNLDLIDDMERQGITINFVEIPRGENPGVTEEYRQRNRAILEAMGRHDLIARLVEGRLGFVQQGVAVTPEFNVLTHVAKVSLPILKAVPILRTWDFGGNPTTVWWQITPGGRIHVLHSIRTANQGMVQHIRDAVLPWQGDHGLTGYEYWDAGDPNGLTPEARDSNVSAVTAIEEMLTGKRGRPASFEPGLIPIIDRVQPIRRKLRELTAAGVPVVQVDPDAKAMIRALSGGWHKKKSPAGIIGDIVKDEHSEHGDAWGYGMGLKYPVEKLIDRRPVRRRPAPQRVPVGSSAHGWMTT